MFVLPIRWWICVRSNLANHSVSDKKSPTAALLDMGRQPKRVRAVSTYRYCPQYIQVHIVIKPLQCDLRSKRCAQCGGWRTLHSSVGVNGVGYTSIHGIPAEHRRCRRRRCCFCQEGALSSHVYPISMVKITFQPRISRRTPPSLCLFYSTPIVKYWLSLLFRLLHIGLLAYSVRYEFYW